MVKQYKLSEVRSSKLNRKTNKTIHIEFISTLKPSDYPSVRNFKKIMKSKIQQMIPKPRNKFLIYRSLVNNMVINDPCVSSFTNVSKITSKMYDKKSPNTDKYLNHLSNEDKKYSESLYNYINQYSNITEQPKRNTINLKKALVNPGKGIKIKSYTKHSKEEPVVIKTGDNMEDVYIKAAVAKIDL